MWCFKSDGLNKVNHLEVVIILEIKRKEDVFPEEVLRVYKGILFLATKYGRLRLGGTAQLANVRSYFNKFKGSFHPMNEVKDKFCRNSQIPLAVKYVSSSFQPPSFSTSSDAIKTKPLLTTL